MELLILKINKIISYQFLIILLIPEIVSLHVRLPPKVWGDFFKKNFSQQFRRLARLPNCFHGDIQTLNFKMT